MGTPGGEAEYDPPVRSEENRDLGDSEAAYNTLVESLRASEARYRELFENANDLVYTVSFEGTFTSLNRTAEETTGFSRDELIGADISAIVPPEFVDTVRDMMRRKITTHGRTTYDIEILSKDGRRIPLEVSSRLIYENSEPVAIQGIARDISERKRAEQQLQATVAELERSNRELQQFAAVASHDMDAPLRGMVTLSRLLHENKADQLDKEGGEWLSLVASSAAHMRELIDDLLVHSRVGASQRPLELVDCHSVVNQAISNIAESIQESCAELRVGELPEVEANPVELVRLFQNLIDNAMKYRGDAPLLIRITAESHENEWQFRVSDNGIGIAQEHQQGIFNVFTRLHGDDEYPGTGIGLATCKKVVERLDGRIWVESEVDKGSTFVFNLPRANPPEV